MAQRSGVSYNSVRNNYYRGLDHLGCLFSRTRDRSERRDIGSRGGQSWKGMSISKRSRDGQYRSGSGAELVELRSTPGCPGCRQAYAEFLGVGSVRMVAEATRKKSRVRKHWIYRFGPVSGEIPKKRPRPKGFCFAENSYSGTARAGGRADSPRRVHHVRTRGGRVDPAGLGNGRPLSRKVVSQSRVPLKGVSAEVPVGSSSQNIAAAENRDVLLARLEAENRKLMRKSPL